MEDTRAGNCKSSKDLIVHKTRYSSKPDSEFIDTFATAHESAGIDEIRTGWTGGGGVEFKIGSGNHWSMKGEYLFADFGQVKTTSTNLTAFTPPIAFPTNVFTHQSDLQQHIFRTGFNFRF
jgi:outer membrane immunogenic protein